MASRGVWKLRHLSLKWVPSLSRDPMSAAGSSKGVLSFIKSGKLDEFKEKHPHINVEAESDAEIHPFVTATYANGTQETVWLRKKNEDEVNEAILKLRNQSGEKYGRKIWSTAQERPMSFQGDWNVSLIARK